MKSRANIALSVRISPCVGCASRSAWAALRQWTIADGGNAPSYGRVVDVSCPASACWSQSRSKRDRGGTSALPGRDGENLPGAGTVVVQSARADESGAGRLGTTVVEIGASSQDNLVTSCYVAHPCARLRMCRREAPSSRLTAAAHHRCLPRGEHLASMRLPWFVIADASSPSGAGDPKGAAGIAEALSLLLPILAFPPVQPH